MDQFIVCKDKKVDDKTCEKYRDLIISLANFLYKIDLNDRDLCDHYGIEFDHHKADSDSHACAEILLKYFEAGAEEKNFIRTFRFV